MPDSDRIIELLVQWDDLRSQGRLATAEELCPEEPELHEELRRRIRRRLRMMEVLEAADETLISDEVKPAAGVPALAGYEILEVLGRGGMGVVYKARQRSLNRVVALKMILSGAHAGQEELARFRLEAETIARLQHPNFVQVFEVGEHDRHAFYSMEYVAGGSLDQRLAEGPLPPREAARLLEVLARAVHAAHQRGVIHCDLKPANILLSSVVPGPSSVIQDGGLSEEINGPRTTDYGHPKITDFGLARWLGEKTGLTQTGAIVGTPSYMAPEQAVGQASAIGPATDVYALGAVLYQALCGRPPFKAASSQQTLEQVRNQEPVSVTRFQPHVPRDLETICMKCLQKEPRKRYLSADDLAEDLRRFLAHEPILARPVGTLESLARWCRRKPVVAGLLAALVLAVVSGFAGIAWEWRRAEQNAIDLALERDHAVASYRLAREALGEVMELQEEPRFQEGELEDIRRHLLRAEAKFYERFLALRGEDPTFRRERALARFRLAFATAELGSAKEALATYQQAVELFDALVADFPAEPYYARRLADSLNGLGVLRLELDHGPEALAAFRRAQGLLEQLTSPSPPDPLDEFNLAMTHSNLGRLHATEERREAAEADYIKARDTFRRLAEQHPGNPKYQLELARTWYRLGFLYQADHRRDEALKAQAQALPILERLVRDHPDVSAYEAALARATQVLAQLQEATGQRRQAIATQRQALDRFTRLAEKHPRARSYLSNWAEAAGFLGTYCYDNGDYVDAEKYHQQAAMLYERLQKIDPTAEMDVANLGGMYCNVGLSLLHRRRFEEALTWYEKGAAALELDAARPRPQRYTREYLIKSCGGRAHALVELGRYADATTVLTRGLELEPQAERSRFLVLRGYARAQVGEHAGAVADAEAGLADPKALPQMVYGAARTYALASAKVGDADLAERHARRALELLQRAKATGYFKETARSNLLKTDKDLEPLRSRADFQEFLAQ